MTEEKVLGYLNIKRKGKNDISLPKTTIGLEFGLTSLLLMVFLSQKFTNLKLLMVGIYLFVDLCLLIVMLLKNNPVFQFYISSIICLIGAIKSFILYIPISKFDFSNRGMAVFTRYHILVAFLVVLISAYMLIKSYMTYKIIKENPLWKAKELIRVANHPILSVSFFGIGVGGFIPLAFIRRGDALLIKSGLSFGFFAWFIACLFTFMFIIILPKSIVGIKFKAHNYFKNNK